MQIFPRPRCAYRRPLNQDTTSVGREEVVIGKYVLRFDKKIPIDTWLFFALLFAFLILMELSRPLVRAEQERAGIGPASRRRRLLIAIAWYGALFAAVVGYWLGIEVARYVLGFLFLAAAFGAVLAAVTLLQRIGTRVWRVGKG